MASRGTAQLADLAPTSGGASACEDALAALFDRARLRVLRATVLIGLLIACGSLVSLVVGLTANGEGGVGNGPPIVLGSAWCVLWALAAISPRSTARCFMHWRITAITLAVANAATVALTGGVESPILAVCMYAGWIAAVVVTARPAIAMALLISCSVLAGYLLAGDSALDVLTGQQRYDAVVNVVLPLVTGLVGVLLATVTNVVLSRMTQTLYGLRNGAPATTTALTALFAGHAVLALSNASLHEHTYGTGAPMSDAEREVVALLADGYAPKEIAALRNVALSTVRSQIKSAKAKTGARTINDLVALTVRAGG